MDFKRRHDGIPATVIQVEYDPNRSARIALISYIDGKKSYILAPSQLRVGATVESGPGADIRVRKGVEVGARSATAAYDPGAP